MTYHELGEFVFFAFMVCFCLGYVLIVLSTFWYCLIDFVKQLIEDARKLDEADEVDEVDA